VLPKTYVETSVISYLTARPSRDEIAAAHQRLTWNCTHIANGFVLQSVNTLCRDAGYEPPIVCTPQELMEG